MRLDHLLSTEFLFQDAGLASVVRPMRREWFPVSRGRAGVEEIMGFRIPFRGSGEWYGYAFGLPDRHPRLVVACGFPDAPGGTPWACGPRVGSWRGAWWFENWIVDASNAGLLSCLLYRDFARLFFLESGFEIDRFVIIVYSVMICRLA